MTTEQSFSQFYDKNPAFSVRQLRWIDFRARDKESEHYSKFAPAFFRIGRRVYIDGNRFLAIAKGESDK